MDTQPEIMGTLLSVAVGLGLSAACGFRIFVPMLVMSIAAKAGYLTLAGSFEWIGSTPALIALASATALEIGAYYLPLIDNLLDTVATPAAVVAGVVATASQVGDLNPMLGWSMAIIGGGGLAASIQGMTSLTRHASALTTGGFGNPLVSTGEAAASVLFSLLAIFVPLVALIAALALIYFVASRLLRRRRVVETTAESTA